MLVLPAFFTMWPAPGSGGCFHNPRMTEPVIEASQRHKLYPQFLRKPRSFVFWAVCVNLVTYAVYPSVNWLASLRSQRYDFITPWDAMIPLVPEFIFVYFSFFPFLALPFWMVGQPDIDALGKRQVAGTLICGLIFVLFPANLAFDRVIPDIEPYRSIFSTMFLVDKPHNLLPSLHIVYTALSCAVICKTQWPRGRHWLCGLIASWSVAICASTMLVHQHHVLDVVTALMLTALLYVLIRPLKVSPQPPRI